MSTPIVPYLFADKSGELPLSQLDANFEVLAEAIGNAVAGPQGPAGPQGAAGLNGSPGAAGPQGQAGTPGAAGTGTFFHIAYANSADGSIGFNQVNGTYIGTYVDSNPVDSALFSAYTWRLFLGAQGPSGTNGIPGTNGADGRTSYLHIKYSNDGGATFTTNAGEDVGTWLGQYVDFTQADSTAPGAYTWAKIQGPTGSQGPQGSQGTPGAAGVSSYFHVAYANSADGTVGFNQSNGVYIGTYVDTTPADGTNPALYTWRLFLGAQGVKGDQGIPGTNGATGQTQYLHIKYSNDGGTTFTANNGETPGSFIGQRVDFLLNDSSNPGDYTWSQQTGAQGATGPQGAQGTPGTNGVSTYFHVAYADSADGATNFNQNAGAYIGTYVDTVAADSQLYTAYKWRLLRGSQGAQGLQGIPGQNGATGETTYLHIKYSNDGGATFTGNTGEDAGTWLGTYVDVFADDSNLPGDYKWAQIQGATGATGAPGVQGAAGANGVDGLPGLSAFMSPSAIIIPADGSGAVTTYAGASSFMTVLAGGAAVDGFTFTKVDGPNVQSTILANAITITSLSAAQDASYVDLTATKAGAQINIRIPVTKAKAGQDGNSTWTLLAHANAYVNGSTGGTTAAKAAGQWDSPGKVYSLESMVNGCFCSFQVTQIGQDVMAGLNTDPLTGDSYPVLDYAFYLTSVPDIRTYESGTESTPAGGPWKGHTTDTVFSITYDNDMIRWFVDGVLKQYQEVGPGKKFFFDTAFSGPNQGFKNIRFGPMGALGAQGPAGAQGPTGASGRRGATMGFQAVGGNSWSDASANANIANTGLGTPVLGDRVTEYNNSAGYSETRYFDGASWITIAVAIDGNLIVTGTVAGNAIATRSITTDRIAIGAVSSAQNASTGNFGTSGSNISGLSAPLTGVLGLGTTGAPVTIGGDLYIGASVQSNVKGVFIVADLYVDNTYITRIVEEWFTPVGLPGLIRVRRAFGAYKAGLAAGGHTFQVNAAINYYDAYQNLVASTYGDISCQCHMFAQENKA